MSFIHVQKVGIENKKALRTFHDPQAQRGSCRPSELDPDSESGTHLEPETLDPVTGYLIYHVNVTR